MASAVESKEISRGPPLSLSIDSPPSTTNFPSPSSSFLPPPMPGAHEFAVKPPPAPRASKKTNPEPNNSANSSPTVTTPKPNSIPSFSGSETSNSSPVSNDSQSADDMGSKLSSKVGGLPPAKSSILAVEPTSSLLAAATDPLSPTTPTPMNASGSNSSASLSPQSSNTSSSNSDLAASKLQEQPKSPATASETQSASAVQENTQSESPALVSPKPSPTPTTATTPTTNTLSLPPSSSSVGNTSPLNTPRSPTFHNALRDSLHQAQRDSLELDSLTSSRPAPPSPSISRRVSTTSSNRSNRSARGGGSRPSSAAMSRANSMRKSLGADSRPGSGHSLHRMSLSVSGASMSPSPNTSTSLNSTAGFPSAFASGSGSAAPVPSAAPSNITISSPARRPRAPLIKIHDFAFPATDERHVGLGPDVPKPNRLRTLNRRLRTLSRAASISSTSSSMSDDGYGYGEEEDGDEDEDYDDEGDGWGGFKFGMGRLSWGFGKAVGAADDGGDTPSSVDFARNFVEGGERGDEAGECESPEDEGAYGEEEDVFGEGGYSEEPLYPGLYRALYAFEPEGIAEMALEEDQIVRVLGRGGGVGWAVVLKGSLEMNSEDDCAEGTSRHALVPESYLEVVKLDGKEG